MYQPRLLNFLWTFLLYEPWKKVFSRHPDWKHLPNTCPCVGPPSTRAGPTSISWNVGNTHPASSIPHKYTNMSLIQQVLALYQGAVRTGDSVELKLWCPEGKEFFTFSKRKKRKRKRRQLKTFSQSFSGPNETQQSTVRSQESPWTVVNYQ